MEVKKKLCHLDHKLKCLIVSVNSKVYRVFAIFCGNGFLHELQQCTYLSGMVKLGGAAEKGIRSLSVAHNFEVLQFNQDFLQVHFIN